MDENKLSRVYSSFLIRYWRFRNELQAERSYFEIEHIQSGERRRVNNVADAQPWMEETAQWSLTNKLPDIDAEDEF